jgi:hypothetical protein
LKLERLGAGVFVIKDFLTEKECCEHIERSESVGYEVATIEELSGPTINKEVRHNDRLIIDDVELAECLYHRAIPFLPEFIDDWRLSGLNERFRFYRYGASQYFKWHKDGSFVRNEHEESMLTFMIYLNDDFEDGYTEFAWEKIMPKAGMALVFPHRLSHRALPPVNGIKYVLRTDVMYRILTPLIN